MCHQRMADVQLIDALDRRDGLDVVVMQPMASIDDQPCPIPNATPSTIRLSSSATSVGVSASA
jgi:hypothetical protein